MGPFAVDVTEDAYFDAIFLQQCGEAVGAFIHVTGRKMHHHDQSFATGSSGSFQRSA